MTPSTTRPGHECGGGHSHAFSGSGSGSFSGNTSGASGLDSPPSPASPMSSPLGSSILRASDPPDQAAVQASVGLCGEECAEEGGAGQDHERGLGSGHARERHVGLRLRHPGDADQSLGADLPAAERDLLGQAADTGAAGRRRPLEHPRLQGAAGRRLGARAGRDPGPEDDRGGAGWIPGGSPSRLHRLRRRRRAASTTSSSSTSTRPPSRRRRTTSSRPWPRTWPR